MIKIINIIGQLSHGGTERQLYELILKINKNIFNPVVICLSEVKEPYGSLLESEGIEVNYLKRYCNFDITRLIYLIRFFKRKQPDIIHAYLHVSNFYAYTASKFSNSTIIVSSRNCEIDLPIYRKIIDGYIFRHSKYILTNSDANKQFLIKKFCVNNNIISVIKNGINLDKYRLNNVAKKNEVTIGMVALFKKQKNIPLFLNVSRKVSQKRKNVQFILVGDGLLFNEMKILKSEMRLDDYVTFTGFSNQSKEIIVNMDIFILTSYKEGFPNVIMEAMALGKPVVATNVGGVSELVQNDKTGYLVPSGDADIMSEKIIDLIDNPQKRIEFGKRGRKFVEENLSVDKMVKETENLYLSILGE